MSQSNTPILLAQASSSVQTESVLEARRSTAMPVSSTAIITTQRRLSATVDEVKNTLALLVLQPPAPALGWLTHSHKLREKAVEAWQSGYVAGVKAALALLESIRQ